MLASALFFVMQASVAAPPAPKAAVAVPTTQSEIAQLQRDEAKLKQCTDKAGVVDAAVQQCYVNRTQAYDNQMNRLFPLAVKNLGGRTSEQGMAFVKEQKAWLAYRDASCGHLSGGTLDWMMQSFCKNDIVASRVQDIASISLPGLTIEGSGKASAVISQRHSACMAKAENNAEYSECAATATSAAKKLVASLSSAISDRMDAEAAAAFAKETKAFEAYAENVCGYYWADGYGSMARSITGPSCLVKVWVERLDLLDENLSTAAEQAEN